MNESKLAQKFERDFQENLAGKANADQANLTPDERERIELAAQLPLIDFSEESGQQAILRAYLLKAAQKTLPRRFRMKQIRNKLNPVWTGIGLVGLVILLIVGMSLILSRMNPIPAGTPPTPSVTPSNATHEANAGNVTITFADLQFGQEINYQTLADAFHQKNPAITINIIPVDHSVQLSNDAIAKQADVILLNGENPASLPGFLALQPLIDGAADFNTKDLWSGSMTSCSDAQDSPSGLPLTLFLQGIYYNPSLFDKYHATYPQPGWTWSQFQQAVTQLGGIANGSPVYGFVDGPEGFLLYPFVGQQLQASGGKLDAQAMASSLTWYAQLAKGKKLYPMPAAVNGVYPLDEMTSLLKNDQAAMWLGATETTGSQTTGIQGVYMPYPVDQPDDYTTPANVFCGAISAGTKNPQAAWAWLDFLSHHDLSGDKTSGLLPVRQSLESASPYFSSLIDQAKSALEYGLAHAWYNPPGLEDVSYQALQAIAGAIQSGSDLETALQAVVAARASVQSTSTPTAQPVVINPLQATPTNLPANVLTISFYAAQLITGDPTVSPNVDPALKALAAEFEKLHPDIHLMNSSVYETRDNNSDFQKLANSYDCFEFASPGIFPLPYTVSDLLDLTPLLDASPTLKNDFYPAFFAPFQKDGKLYGLPADVDITYIAYNADLLTQLGIPFPTAGWTYEDFLALAVQAANPHASKPIYGFGYDVPWLLRSQGILWYDDTVQPPKATFTTDEMTKAFEWIQGLSQKGIFIPGKYSDFLNAIVNGQVAFWITDGFTQYNQDPWDMASHPIFNQDLSYKVGYVPLPLLASGASTSTELSMVGYYISSHTTQAKVTACWDWIQFLSDHPSIFGGYSPRQSVLPKEGVGEDAARFAVVQEAVQQYNNDAYADQPDPLLLPYRIELSNALATVISGGEVTAALAKAQSDADAYWDCISKKDLIGLDTAQISALVQPCYVPTQTTPQP